MSVVVRACRDTGHQRYCAGARCRRGAARGHEHTYGCRHGRGRSRHQAQFQAFADANGGTREASTAGYTASADYVAAQMEGAGYEVTRQPFEYNYFEELAPATLAGTSAAFPFTYEPGDNISTMDYSRLGNLLGRRPGGGRRRAAAGWAAGRSLQLGLRGGGLRRVHRRHSLSAPATSRSRSRTRSRRVRTR